MTSTPHPQLVTAAEAARLLGVTRQRFLELATSAAGDFPPAQPTPTGGRVWSRVAVQTWAAAQPDPGPVYTGPEPPPLFDHAPKLQRVVDCASDEAWALNHDSIDLDHLVLGMLRPKCPGAARAVLESFGVRAEPLRQAFIDSMGDLYEVKPKIVRWSEATQRALERAGLEAARLADAEVTSEHVLLALASRWENACTVTGWLARCGVTAAAVRRRVVDATEGVALPEPPALLGPPPADHPGLAAGLDLAPNPLGHDPRRRGPWGSMAFDVPENRPFRVGMLRRQYLIDRDGYPVRTTDGRPVHVVVDEHGVPVLDEHGRQMLGPVEVPEGGTVIDRYEPS
jgi:hypothetical protein